MEIIHINEHGIDRCSQTRRKWSVDCAMLVCVVNETLFFNTNQKTLFFLTDRINNSMLFLSRFIEIANTANFERKPLEKPFSLLSFQTMEYFRAPPTAIDKHGKRKKSKSTKKKTVSMTHMLLPMSVSDDHIVDVAASVHDEAVEHVRDGIPSFPPLVITTLPQHQKLIDHESVFSNSSNSSMSSMSSVNSSFSSMSSITPDPMDSNEILSVLSMQCDDFEDDDVSIRNVHGHQHHHHDHLCLEEGMTCCVDQEEADHDYVCALFCPYISVHIPFDVQRITCTCTNRTSHSRMRVLLKSLISLDPQTIKIWVYAVHIDDDTHSLPFKLYIHE